MGTLWQKGLSQSHLLHAGTVGMSCLAGAWQAGNNFQSYRSLCSTSSSCAAGQLIDSLVAARLHISCRTTSWADGEGWVTPLMELPGRDAWAQGRIASSSSSSLSSPRISMITSSPCLLCPPLRSWGAGRTEEEIPLPGPPSSSSSTMSPQQAAGWAGLIDQAPLDRPQHSTHSCCGTELSTASLHSFTSLTSRLYTQVRYQAAGSKVKTSVSQYRSPGLAGNRLPCCPDCVLWLRGGVGKTRICVWGHKHSEMLLPDSTRHCAAVIAGVWVCQRCLYMLDTHTGNTEGSFSKMVNP